MGTDLIPAGEFFGALEERGEDFRAFKYNEELNCVFIQRGQSVLVLPAFKRPDSSVFIDKELGFRTLQKVLGPERMELIRRALSGEDTSGFEHLNPVVDPDAPMAIIPLGDA